ncbi:MAG: Rnf-Nqr domain containing protein, partial [Butyricicoccus sp.]
MSFGKNLKEGLFTDNPVLVQLIGLCPTLATTTSITNGIGMGLSATAVLICSNIVISLLRKIIPNKVRIAAYITVIAGFVT